MTFAHDFSQKRRSSPLPRLVLLGAALSFLVACATTRPGVDLPPMPTWEARRAVLGAVNDWRFKGRIAVKTGDEGFNGKINWSQSGDEFFATVGGPLGIGTVKIEGDQRTVVLTDKDGQRTTMLDAEAELRLQYGWTIPVASLRYWALGIPDPTMPADTELDQAGRLTRLLQSNWTVVISQYRQAAGQEIPRTLTATNPDTRVRLVLDSWRFFER